MLHPPLTVPPLLLTLVIVTQRVIVMPKVLHHWNPWMSPSTLLLMHTIRNNVCLEGRMYVWYGVC